MNTWTYAEASALADRAHWDRQMAYKHYVEARDDHDYLVSKARAIYEAVVALAEQEDAKLAKLHRRADKTARALYKAEDAANAAANAETQAAYEAASEAYANAARAYEQARDAAVARYANTPVPEPEYWEYRSQS